MKKIWIVAFVCTLVSVAGFAQTPSQSLSKEALATILGHLSPVPSSCATQPTRQVFAASIPSIGLEALSSATVDYASGAVTTATSSCDGLIGQAYACCMCNQSYDCVYCCRCAGHTYSACAVTYCP